jgi:spore coat polysaccharide biosynthesis protein SpsF
MKTLAIIQARMGSSRLPGKVLRPILGKPMLWHIVNRLRLSHSISDVVVAVPNDAPNEVLRKFCDEYGIKCYAGSENDVLDRYYQAAKQFGGDPIIRITADCPLADPKLIDNLIELYKSGNYDHVGVAAGAGAERLPSGRFPDGLDAECFSFSALERAWREGKDPRDREHVTRYIWNNKEIFRCGDLKSKQDYPGIRLTVDHIDDFRLVSKIYESLYQAYKPFLLDEVIDFLDSNPDLLELNRSIAETHTYRDVLDD